MKHLMEVTLLELIEKYAEARCFEWEYETPDRKQSDDPEDILTEIKRRLAAGEVE